MKKVKVLGKTVPVLVLVLLGVGLVSATLLTYFGTITTTANVEQAVTLIGNTEHTIPEAAPGGEEFCFFHKIKNDASVDILVGFETTPAYEGVTTGVHEVPETTTLTLCEKNPVTWQCNSGATATLEFDTVNTRFKGTLTTTGLDSVDYALIYYPDQEDRFASDKWNGAGGEVITTFTGDQTGLVIDEELNMNLPKETDWNRYPSPDYCSNHNGFDNYNHCKGAKLWIVPVNDLTSGDLPLITWNPTAWLFETDLIVYSDCDKYPMWFTVDMVKGDLITELTTKTKSLTPMLICYDFNTAIAPGTYVINTKIVPK